MSLTDVFAPPQGTDIAWCPGCGNFPIVTIIKSALERSGLRPQDVCLVSGIGQAAKTPQYIGTHMFNGLHGRALPVATAIKLSNPQLKVIATSGDGCMLGEGGNHFIHTIRRNPNFVAILHDNRVYGLTKGQAAPTAEIGLKTKLQRDGVYNEPINPVLLALSLHASFVARAFCGDIESSVKILIEAINHPGFAIIDMLQPCVTYNKRNTYAWFKENTKPLPEDHDRGNRSAAVGLCLDESVLHTGVYFQDPSRPSIDSRLGRTGSDGPGMPLHRHQVRADAIRDLLAAMV